MVISLIRARGGSSHAPPRKTVNRATWRKNVHESRDLAQKCVMI
jgi:hypothetical protein